MPALSGKLFWLDVGGPDHLVPLLSLLGEELAEVGGGARETRATQTGKPRLDPGIGECCFECRTPYMGR